MNHVRVVSSDDWMLWRELRLTALADAPYAFSSRLADWQGAGDTEARWRRRLDDVPLNLIADIEGRAVGIASGVRAGLDQVELISMWVDAAARGVGVGTLLIGALIDWAERERAREVLLRVYADNLAAVALYRRNGFERTGVVESQLGGKSEWVMLRSLR
jgi:ribosomal protein S18 acetylase RimI-like enzyme